MWLLLQQESFFANWISRLVNRYILYVEKGVGDYVDKWYTLHLSQVVVHEVISKFTLRFDPASYLLRG